MAVMTAIALGVAVAGAAASGAQAKKGVAAQKKGNKARRKAVQLQNMQAKREFLRKFRQAQANTLTSAIAAGVGFESSAIQGTLGSEQSQRTTALQEFSRSNQLGEQALRADNQAGSSASRAGTFGQISGFAMQFAGGGFGK